MAPPGLEILEKQWKIIENNEKHIKSIRDGNYLSTIQAEKAKKKSNSTIQELFIKNMKDNGYKKRKSERVCLYLLPGLQLRFRPILQRVWNLPTRVHPRQGAFVSFHSRSEQAF